jgi:hypothetical protein
MASTFEALTLLTPYDVDKSKVRIGANSDGGYILLADLSPDQPVISYGISVEYTFDRCMAERGHTVHMFDPTILGISAPHPNMRFFREGIAGATRYEESLFTIEEHLARHNIQGDHIVLKMDVEGAELEALSATDEGVLRRFAQIVVEVHRLDRLGEQDYRELFHAAFERLNRHFTLFHAHANNYDGSDKFHFVDGMPLSEVIELSYVRTDLVARQPSATVYPTNLDYPNVAQRDKLMWFYPFMPLHPTSEAFAASFEHVRNTARA